MLNYIRASTGHMAPRAANHEPKDSTFRTAVFFFDDGDPEATRAALAEARDTFARGRVHVWRWVNGMPFDLHEIGYIPPPKDVLQPVRGAGFVGQERAAEVAA